MKRYTALCLCLLLLLPLLCGSALAAPEEADAPDGERIARLFDGNVETRILFKAGDALSLLPSLSPDAPMQGVFLRFFDAPGEYTVTEIDASGAVVATASYPGDRLERYVPLSGAGEGGSVQLSFTKRCALSEATFCAAGEPLPSGVRDWRESDAESVDLLLLCGAPVSETRDFAGLLPYYAKACGLSVAVAYPYGWADRTGLDEALNALYSAGVTAYPVIGALEAPSRDTYLILKKYWRANDLLPWLQATVSAAQPKVVVTNGSDDALNDYAGVRLSELVLEAYAGGNSEGFGTVDKLYVLDAAGATVPPFDLPLAALEGKTAYDASAALYEAFATQRLYDRSVTRTGYRLVGTRVGEDTAGNDLFEHVPAVSAIADVQAPPTDTPAPAPDVLSPSPSPASTSPTPAPANASGQTTGGDAGAELASPGLKAAVLVLAAGALASLALATALFSEDRAHGAAYGRRLLLTLAPFVVGTAVALVLLLRGGVSLLAPLPRTTEPPAPTATAAPTLSPTPAPLPAETPAETESAAPTETPYDPSSPYRAPDEPAEVVSFDSEHGHWEYRSDTLSVMIDRIGAEYNGEPVVYFVADVQTTDIYEFRSLFCDAEHSGRGSKLPDVMAQEACAVLAITGDNMINNERDLKGLIIRDGRVYSKLQGEDSVALYPDMSLRIVPAHSATANDLLEQGVRHAYSFGPTLVDGGAVNPRAKYHRVRRKNPRSAIGMVEPGHYIAIVVDGRQRLSGYSVGMTVMDLAELFVEYGCETAYNLDGGVSAAMIFMGHQINSHSGQRTGDPNDISFQRRMPDALAFGYSALVPTFNEPEETPDVNEDA